KWSRKAADLGSMRGRNALAILYYRGEGNIPVDKLKALALVESSACQGYSLSQNSLGKWYAEGMDGLPKDNQKAYAWFTVAISNGYDEAKESKEVVSKKMTPTEIKKANNLAEKYIKKYASPMNNDDDTYKSTQECKYP
uniref:tetratricopeptide repeat protein n=1 Tax=Serratia marcescens TaxID=615 RepID=UPI0034D2C9B2